MQQPEKQAPDRKQPWVGQPRGNEDDEINLVELLYRLIEKWKIIALASLLGALIAAVYIVLFYNADVYGDSKLYVVNTKDSAINLSDLQIGKLFGQRLYGSFLQLACPRDGASASWAGLHVQPAGGDGFCEKPKDTRILYVSVVSDDPQEAKDMADTYAQVAREFIAVKMDTEQPNIFEEALLPSGPSSPNKKQKCHHGIYDRLDT